MKNVLTTSYFFLALLLTIPFMTSCNKDVEGCTDSTANNYDADADTNDGSCTYDAVVVMGCTNMDATNYDADATEDDGTCIVEGCTDAAANNYNAEATQDDGSCIIEGCTEADASNYNPDATQDDGSCSYVSQLFNEGTTNGIYEMDATCDGTPSTYAMIITEDATNNMGFTLVNLHANGTMVNATLTDTGFDIANQTSANITFVGSGTIDEASSPLKVNITYTATLDGTTQQCTVVATKQ